MAEMGDIPITGLEELESHLEQLAAHPETPLNAKLFDEVELQLTDSNIPSLIRRILRPLVQILIIYQNDPTILASLSIKLLKPVEFAQSLTLAPESALLQALKSPAPAVNILAIKVLEKATSSPGDTSILSIMDSIIRAFLRTWLSTPHVEVGEKATQVLGDLLEVDCERRISAGISTKMKGLQLTNGMPPGQGFLWQRIFHDRSIYELIFSLCSSQTIGNGQGQLDERQKSLAQGRLLRILPRLSALDFHAISHTNYPEVDKEYGLPEGEGGLLYFAMVDMVNKEEDMLMHITLIDLFVEFLEVMSTTELTRPMMNYLASLVKMVALSDNTLYKSLESLALSPESPPELVDLLVKLNQYQQEETTP